MNVGVDLILAFSDCQERQSHGILDFVLLCVHTPIPRVLLLLSRPGLGSVQSALSRSGTGNGRISASMQGVLRASDTIWYFLRVEVRGLAES